MSPALVAALVVVALYAAAVLALVLAGRRADAAALARFAPDCAVLLGRLARDPRLSRPRRALLALAVLYLASPVDLVPDFVPVAGQLDDVVIVVLLLRGVLRSGGPQIVREHWPGPERSLQVVLRAGTRMRHDG